MLADLARQSRKNIKIKYQNGKLQIKVQKLISPQRHRGRRDFKLLACGSVSPLVCFLHTNAPRTNAPTKIYNFVCF